MNEFCRIGLHAFTDWEEKATKKGTETRRCRRCTKTEDRPWQPAPKRPPYDPYRDIG